MNTWPDVLSALVAGQDLDSDATTWAMEEILSGNATPTQIAGFAIGLRSKGETLQEVQGLVDSMYHHATPLNVDGRVVDIVGTGGDRARTVNISTMSAVVIAGAGIPVVKHGNRAASSASGSADVLEQLGVRLDVPATKILEVLQATGITFCFAPVFHSSFRFTAVPRRELGIPTVFNFLGPLTNPARPSAMAVGVADARMAPLMAGVLARRGADGFVFRGDDGLDEITTTTTSRVWIADGTTGDVSEDAIDPRAFGFDYTPGIRPDRGRRRVQRQGLRADPRRRGVIRTHGRAAQRRSRHRGARGDRRGSRVTASCRHRAGQGVDRLRSPPSGCSTPGRVRPRRSSDRSG